MKAAGSLWYPKLYLLCGSVLCLVSLTLGDTRYCAEAVVDPAGAAACSTACGSKGTVTWDENVFIGYEPVWIPGYGWGWQPVYQWQSKSKTLYGLCMQSQTNHVCHQHPSASSTTCDSQNPGQCASGGWWYSGDPACNGTWSPPAGAQNVDMSAVSPACSGTYKIAVNVSTTVTGVDCSGFPNVYY